MNLPISYLALAIAIIVAMDQFVTGMQKASGAFATPPLTKVEQAKQGRILCAPEGGAWVLHLHPSRQAWLVVRSPDADGMCPNLD